MPGTLTVACKLPNGLHLEVRHPKPDGWKVGDSQPPVAQRVTVNGANSSRVVGGYGITEGVDADFFEKWKASNATLDAVRQKLIFAMPQTANAEAKAREGASIKNGLEPLDPDKPGPGLERLKAD